MRKKAKVSREVNIEHLTKFSLLHLDLAYNIGRHIQKKVSEQLSESQNINLNPASFKQGPHPRIRQLEYGLTLVKREGVPFEIDTIFGSWKVIEGYCSDDEWNKVFKILDHPLGLVLYKEEVVHPKFRKRPYYAITGWDDQQIPWPSYKVFNEYISPEKVRAIWEQFSLNRSF